MELSIQELARAPAMIELLQAAFDPELEVELELVDAPEAGAAAIEVLPSVIVALDAPAELPSVPPSAPPAEVPALADPWFDEFDESDAAMIAALDEQAPPERRGHPLVRWLFGRFTADRAAALAR